MLKKFFAILLALMLALGLCGCQNLSADDVVVIAHAVDALLSDGAESSGPDAAQWDANEAEETSEGTGAQATSDASDVSPKASSYPATEPVQSPDAPNYTPEPKIDRDGVYDSKDDVALYIHTYGQLPSNYITKKQAQNLGWEGGYLEPYAPGKCIGGSYFGNYEGALPNGNYKECDIGTLGKKSRGAKRLIYSDDGRIYYTDDHYETFTQLY